MTRKKVSNVLLMVLMSVFLLCCDSFHNILTTVERNVTLPCKCSGQVVKWDIISPIKATIARCQNGKGNISKSFQDRFSFSGNTRSGNYNIHINSTQYNDMGIYSCSCDGEIVSQGKLDVCRPETVTVIQGESVTLPCFADTREHASDIQWTKDGILLLKYPYGKPDEASKGGFSVSNNCYQKGNCSLHVISAELSDSGLYRCHIHDESRQGHPCAVLLVVKKRQEKDQPDRTPNSKGSLGIGILIGILIGATGAGVIIFIVKYKRHCNETANVGISIQEEFPMSPIKPSSTQLIQH